MTGRSPRAAELGALLLAGLAAIAGCATTPPNTCEQFEQTRRASRHDTVYRYSDVDTRLAAKRFAPAPNASVAVRWYTLRTNRPQIGACDYLYLTQDLYLLRSAEAPTALIEQHEFYAADGKRIATKREDVSRQLRTSGFYSAAVPLPIPKDAPPGAYRIVIRLLAKTAGAPERTLATAAAEFQVLAPVSRRDADRNGRRPPT